MDPTITRTASYEPHTPQWGNTANPGIPGDGNRDPSRDEGGGKPIGRVEYIKKEDRELPNGTTRQKPYGDATCDRRGRPQDRECGVKTISMAF